jgi:putative flippase GtrA
MKLILSRNLVTWLARPTVAKMISFGVIGVGNTVIDLAIFSVAYSVLAVPLVASNILAWLVAMSISYVMNTMITFRAESGRVLRRKDYFNFAASGMLGVIATTATLVMLSHFMAVILAKLASILAGFVVNFTMTHFVVFRQKKPELPDGPNPV